MTSRSGLPDAADGDSERLGLACGDRDVAAALIAALGYGASGPGGIEYVDEFTFALRYGREVRLYYFGVCYVIPVPVTQKAVEALKSCRVWEGFEPIIGPYLSSER